MLKPQFWHSCLQFQPTTYMLSASNNCQLAAFLDQGVLSTSSARNSMPWARQVDKGPEGKGVATRCFTRHTSSNRLTHRPGCTYQVDVGATHIALTHITELTREHNSRVS